MLSMSQLAGFNAGGEHDPYWDSVVLLLHMDGVNGETTFTDEKGNVFTRYGNTVISTAQSKFGGASAYFDGSGDYLECPDKTSLEFASDDFAAECFIRLADISGRKRILSKLDQDTTGWALSVDDSRLEVMIKQGGNIVAYISAGTLAINTWHHVAFTKNGNTIRAFIDGTSVGQATQTSNYTEPAPTPFLIGGCVWYGAYYFNGYIDEIRITKGVARYTANFTPPTVPFPNS